MAPKFGTSGLRGLVTELTDPLCAGYVRAFLRSAATDGTLLIGRDLRASSPRIARAVAGAAAAAGLEPRDCGVLPTPALALAAAARGTAAVMVTGSHIPDDRNGLKFYTAAGEITKEDEAAITDAWVPAEDVTPADPAPDPGPLGAYRDRYRAGFAPDALAGLRIGVYEHSSAARELLTKVLRDLGAEVVPLGRAESFVPVDTEALDPDMRARLAGWAAEHGLDAIVSTDGDADRPMVADAGGRVIPGDRLGPLTADFVGAEAVVTPVSSNTLVEAMGRFEVVRTRIGSPYVIEGMAAAGARRVVGYEANGGFLLGFRVEAEAGSEVGERARDGTGVEPGTGARTESGPGAEAGAGTGTWSGAVKRSLDPLPTRDALLPILAPLALARARGTSLAALDAALPARFTATDRLTGVPPERSAALLAALETDAALRARILGPETPAAVDRTDGYRATFADGRILHLRPSGNAPEFRAYTEAAAPEAAQAELAALLERLSDALVGLGA